MNGENVTPEAIDGLQQIAAEVKATASAVEFMGMIMLVMILISLFAFAGIAFMATARMTDHLDRIAQSQEAIVQYQNDKSLGLRR